MPARSAKSIANFRDVLMKRTYTVYRHMADRAKPRPLPFSLKEFRDFVALKMCGDVTATCEYCGVALTIANVVWDHKIPLSRGGSLRLDNLAPCCDTDNRTKGELKADEYLFLMRGIRSMSESAQRDILRRLRSNSTLVVQRMLLTKPKANHQPKGETPHGNEEKHTTRSGLLFETT